MDIKKLYKKLIKYDAIKDIPGIYVLRVAIALLEIINGGECYFDTKEANAYVD